MEFSMVDAIVDQHGRKPWALISILQDIQEHDGYLSPEVLRRVSERMEIPLTGLYGVVILLCVKFSTVWTQQRSSMKLKNPD